MDPLNNWKWMRVYRIAPPPFYHVMAVRAV